ncbi:cytochrome ubiquinol oxidase subunit I [Bacillus massiliigorillae]|uniref:cytochrome ubiquinol oxidase subunit I n=1 Tax=Bacillus massiliigorillae TaxID=1243664 RepID=UPI0003A1EC32|nr:cytochrome ubiquinol oxidase subunit I [Bacillus massiliigorillae]
MDVLDLARFQYAATTIFHFLFVPMSIGTIFIVAIMETLYVVKKKKIYLEMSKFWGKIFLLSFAIGVVTGILQEFQFGMNWSEYSRFVGDVFGAPLAIEALLAFFMESTFIGIWIFGREKLPKWVIAFSAWMVSIGTLLSALWILAANSFMQHPVGIKIVDGKPVLNDFMALVKNGQLLVEFPHVVMGALATAGLLVGGISAYKLLKKQNIEFFHKSFKIAMIISLISGIGIAFSGHSQAQYLMDTQPMKMAASEGLWEDSGDPASWSAIANINSEEMKNEWSLEIPYILSFLAYNKFEGSVEGMKTLQAKYEKQFGEDINYIPHVETVYWSFRIMAIFGGIMIVISLLSLVFMKRDSLLKKRWLLKLAVAAIVLPPIANSAGWIMTEIGRQPWTVMGLYTTAQSVSPNVTAGSLWFSIIAFCGSYLILGIIMVYMVVKVSKKGPYPPNHKDDSVELLNKEAFEQ